MWPVGYIIGSPYSPFHLELQMPKRHWRDSIEDLLALEYGGEMINLDNRKEETEVGRQVRFERASGLLLSSQVVHYLVGFLS